MNVTLLTTFLYFAYGSNLLARRIHLKNPSAKRMGIAKLENYRLDFKYRSRTWNGAAATIVPDNSSCVWGALWEIHNDNLATLDRQEGVSLGIYKVVPVTVYMPSGESVKCRTYQLVKLPLKLKDGECLPAERKPNTVYMDIIIEGAEESVLPEKYVTHLKSFKHSGYCNPLFHNCG